MASRVRPHTALFGTLGVLTTSLGAGLLLAPEFVLRVGPIDDAVTALSAVDTATIGLIAGVVVLVALFVTARSRPAAEREELRRVDSRFERAATVPPERAAAGHRSLTAAALDDEIQQAVETGNDSLQEVRSLLRETATSAYAERMGVPESQAADAVDRGKWTDDPVAARFLAGSDGPGTPLGMRLRHWLVPTEERTRRIERTVAAIERVSER